MALFVKVCVFPGCEVNTTNLRASQPFLIKAPCGPSRPASCPVTGSTPALQPQKPLSGAPPAPLHLPPQPRGENAQVAQRQRIHLPLQERWVPSLGGEDPLEEEAATHSSTLAWRTPWTEALGGLQSLGVTESWTGPGTHACNCTNTQALCKMGAGVWTEAPRSSRLVSLFTITGSVLSKEMDEGVSWKDMEKPFSSLRLPRTSPL